MARKNGKDRGLLERPAGSGIWWIYYVRDGRRHYEKVGPDKEEARRRYIQRKAACIEGRPVPADLRDAKKYTVFEAVQSYLDVSQQNLSRKTDIYHAERVVLAMGESAIDDLRAGDIERWMSHRASETSASTANRGFMFLRRCCRRAVRDGLARRDPTEGVKALREPPPRDRYLLPAEAQYFRAHMPDRDWLIVCLAGYTGLRRGNVFGIRRRDVDLSQCLIRVQRTKRNRPQLVPIHPELVPLLRAQLEEADGSEWLFPGRNKGKAMQAWSWVRKHFNTVRDAGGMTGLRFHDMRHSFASWLLLEAGAGLRETQELVGHADLSSTQRYTHIPHEHLRALVGRLSFLHRPTEVNDNLNDDQGKAKGPG